MDMLTPGYIAAGSCLLAEMGLLLGFIGVALYGTYVKHVNLVLLGRLYQVTKGAFVLAIANPVIAIIFDATVGDVDGFDIGFVLLAAPPLVLQKIILALRIEEGA